MVASETYAEFLREQLAPLGRVTLRRMFGKSGVFCDGVMLGMVTENTLYFRVDDQNRETFREAEAFPPLNYAKQGADHRPRILARAGAAVRRTRRVHRVGASCAGSGTPDRGQEAGAEAAQSAQSNANAHEPPGLRDTRPPNHCLPRALPGGGVHRDRRGVLAARFQFARQSGKTAQRFRHLDACADAGDHHVNHDKG